MNKRANPLQNEIWRHFKGGEYKIITIQIRENNQLAKICYHEKQAERRRNGRE